MKRIIREYKKNPPEKALFERVKKATYGSLVRDFSSVQSVATTLSEAALGGVEPFSAINTAASANYETLIDKLESLDEENASLSVVDNKG